MPKNTQILLARRPVGDIQDSDFKIVKTDVPSLFSVPNAQEKKLVLVKVLYVSVDPAMRGWMTDRKSYIAPVKLGSVMRAATVGVVVESCDKRFKKGDAVSSMLGWQEYAIVPSKKLQKVPRIPGFPLSCYLGVLGGTGITAYFGLLEIGVPKAGETVLISGAAGAVGSVVGQIAKHIGCRVVGLAGSARKCQWLKELGFDEAINYRETKDMRKAFRKTCPRGVDVYFDNVGGDILDAALTRLNFKARVVLCGAISQYNATAPPEGPSNYLSLLVNRAKMEGFILFDYADRFPEAISQLADWVKAGVVQNKETVVDGIESAPFALKSLFTGKNTGKFVVRVAADEQDKRPRSRL